MTRRKPSKPPTKEGAEFNSLKSDLSESMLAQKTARLQSKQYRDAFVASQISVGLPFQIRALREQRGWKQSKLAEKADMLQPRISAMERPGESKFNLETLRRIASAFDVALEVRFVPFSELVDWSERFNPDTFNVQSFAEDFSKKKPAPKEVKDERLKVISGVAQPAAEQPAELRGIGDSEETSTMDRQWLGAASVVSIDSRRGRTVRKRRYIAGPERRRSAYGR